MVEKTVFKASSKAGELVVTDEAIYHTHRFLPITKRYSYSEVLCVYSEVGYSPPRTDRVQNPHCEDNPNIPCEEEIHYPGRAWGNVKLFLWNGKFVTVYKVSKSGESFEDCAVVFGEIGDVVDAISPYVPYYDMSPSVWAGVNKMAKEGRSREEIKRAFQVMISDPIYRKY
jgi:hypothetical protein